MALITKSIKGTADMLPSESYKHEFIQQSIFDIAKNHGFKQIGLPVFEHTELFKRGVGDTTDVVQKEMYTFDDKGGRSITLRPEGTAGVVRSYLENGLFNEPMPQKLCYNISCYRYEKPQAGRLREFHQFGAECIGSAAPAADAEMISMANDIFNYLGVKNLKLELNSIGCKTCRAEYHKALKVYFDSKVDELCGTCHDRLDKNPMRILDCKSPVCHEIGVDAPKVTDFLCEECDAHFTSVQTYLKAMGIDFSVNSSIVRGLDYYSRTVFEFVSQDIGAQGTVCGGGRYDGLIEQMGGKPTPALGFAMGLERLMLILQNQKAPFPNEQKCDVYIATMGEAASIKAAQIVTSLRSEGMHAEFDVVGRSVKAQMKFANKIGAAFTIVIGDNELETKQAKLKNMDTGEDIEVNLDSFEDDFMRISINESLKGLEDFGYESNIDINSILNGNLF